MENMERKSSQPPRVTSTPRVCRNTLSLQETFNEISPIMPILAPVRKTKSLIPLFKEPTQSNELSKRRTVATVSNIAPLGEKNNIVQPQPCSAVGDIAGRVLFSRPGSVTNKNKISQPSTSETKDTSKTSLEHSCAVGNLVKGRSTSRLSLLSKKPSLLPSIPETSPAQGPAMKPAENPSGVLIFKSPVRVSNIPVVWNVPSQPKKVVALKRKNNVDQTAMKTSFPVQSNAEGVDERWFGSSGGLSPLETSFPQKKRKTYLIKKSTKENKENSSKNCVDFSNTSQNRSNNSTKDIILKKKTYSKKSSLKKNKEHLNLIANKTVDEKQKPSLKLTDPVVNSDRINKIAEPVDNVPAAINLTFRIKQTNGDKKSSANSLNTKLKTEDNINTLHTGSLKVVLVDDIVEDNDNKKVTKISKSVEKNDQPFSNNENSESLGHKNDIKSKVLAVLKKTENELRAVTKTQESDENNQNNVLVGKDEIPQSDNVERTENEKQFTSTISSSPIRKRNTMKKRKTYKENDYQQLTESEEKQGRGRPKRNTTVTPLNSNTVQCNEDNPKFYSTRSTTKLGNHPSVEESSTKNPKPHVDEKIPAVSLKQKKQKKNETLAKPLNETSIKEINKETQPLKSDRLTKSRRVSKLVNMSDEEKITLIKDMTKKKPISDTTAKIHKGSKKSKPAQQASSQKSYGSKNQENKKSFEEETVQVTENILETVVADNSLPTEVKIKLTETTTKSARKNTLPGNTAKVGKTSAKPKIVIGSLSKERNESIQSLKKELVQVSGTVVSDSLPEEDKGIVKKTVVKQRALKTKSHHKNKEPDEKLKEELTDEVLNDEKEAHTTERRNKYFSKNTSTNVPQQVASKNVISLNGRKRKTRDAETISESPEPKKTKGKGHNKKDKVRAPSPTHVKVIEPENKQADDSHRETEDMCQTHKNDSPEQKKTNGKGRNREDKLRASSPTHLKTTEPENKQADNSHRETKASHQTYNKGSTVLIEECNPLPSRESQRVIYVETCFGLKNDKKSLLQPGVTMHTFLHKTNFVMTGCLLVETGSSINKASTNTTYFVTQGAATVRLSSITKLIRAEDVNNSFFIPRYSDFSITNEDKSPLKMLFTKFMDKLM